MTGRKHRLTVTVDPELVEAGNNAVVTGAAESMSGWVSAALTEKVRRDAQLEHLHAAIEEYEAEHGVITAEEITSQRRIDREDAVIVRGLRLRAAGPDQPTGAAASG